MFMPHAYGEQLQRVHSVEGGLSVALLEGAVGVLFCFALFALFFS